MKIIKFLLGIFTVAIVMASCASTQEASGENYDESNTRRVGNRVYVDDPFYGTVILERDPFTGRYYDVTYGYRYGSSYNSYRGYRNNYPSRNYRRGTISPRPSQPVKPAQPSQQQIDKTREEARKKILGN